MIFVNDAFYAHLFEVLNLHMRFLRIMVLLAMSFGLPAEIIIAFFIIVLTIGVFVILIIARLFFKKLTYKRIFVVSVSIFALSIIVLFITEKISNFIKSPMIVRKYQIEGDYVINRKMFPGKNCDWQYEHYTLRIDKDILYLNVFNNNKLIRIYERPVFYIDKGKHTFIEFYNYRKIDYEVYKEIESYNFDTVVEKYRDDLNPDQIHIREQIEKDINSIQGILYDSIFKVKRDSAIYYVNHHMLIQNPVLHADPFKFNIILQSTKYGNMFFIKGTRKEKYK